MYIVTITNPIFASPEGSFAIFGGRLDGGRKITLKGELRGLVEGDIIEAEGFMGDRGGEPQLQVTRYMVGLPKTAAGMVGYLTDIPDMGPARARKLVEAVGPEQLNALLLGDPQDLEGVLLEARLPKNARESLVKATREMGPEREILIYLASLGMTPGLARQVIKTLGTSAPAMVRGNPYVLMRVSGIAFDKADGFARASGIALEDPRRVRAAIVHVLTEETRHGHVFLPRDELEMAALKWLTGKDGGGAALTLVDVSRGLDELLEDGRVVDAEGIYRPSLLAAERDTARHIRRLAGGDVREVSETELDKGLAKFKKDTDIELSPDQREAIGAVVKDPVVILTGSPGEDDHHHPGPRQHLPGVQAPRASLRANGASCSPSVRGLRHPRGNDPQDSGPAP